jgi:HK97 family phage major capsid protein
MVEGADKLKEILDAQKAALTEFQSYKSETGNAVRAMEGKFVDVEKTIQAITASVKSLTDAIAERAVGEDIGQQVADEFKKTGGFSIVKCLFEPKSREREVSNEYALTRKDLSQGVDSAGGYIVPQVALPGFIDSLRSAAVVWPQAGLTILDGLRGSPVTIPRVIGNSTVQWIGENVAPTPSDVTFGQLSMTPKKAAGIVKVSNRLIRMGTPAETIVRRNLSTSLGLEVDRVILRGSGAAGEPRGIGNTAGIVNVEIDTNGGPFTFEVAADMQIAVDESDATPRNQGYVGHPRAFHTMKTERIAQFSGQTAGAYVVLPMSDSMISDLLGFKFLRTTNIPKNLAKGSGTNLTEVYFGNWADVYFGLWTDIILKSSDVTGDPTGSAFTQDQTWIMAQIECDVALARPTSFALVNDAATT